MIEAVKTRENLEQPEEVLWQAKRAVIRAAGHWQCALGIMRIQGFNPLDEGIQDLILEMSNRVTPITITVRCEVCRHPVGPVIRGPLPKWVIRELRNVDLPSVT